MNQTIDPARAVMDLAVAYWSSRCLHVIAELGVADALGDQPRSAEELARASGVRPQLLQRVLRALANHGIFAHDGERFAHNAASRMLRSDAATSLRSLARMMGLPVHWDAYRELESALRTGEPSIAKVTEGGLFPHLRKHPEEARLFHGAMLGKSLLQIGPIVEAYDFQGFKTIGDIGGGLGHLLYAVLERAPAARGILFDLPDVVAQARERTHARVSYVGGDFFKDPIPACDLYLMMTVLHDWSDAESVAILNNLKAGAPRGAKLLILEGVVRPTAQNDIVLDIDIEMLVMTTGHERSEKEWASMLSGAGMRLSRIIPAGPWTSILEVQLV
ncbi:MAG TPA: methyltransferase [Steroidobacteraceae bacterium]|nr:methyltransferase [Steroidobacteraceae bacterium]